jgi:hypothetical protein
MFNYQKAKRVSILLLFILFSSVAVAAQSANKGGIKGKVRDENGNGIPGVAVTVLRNDDEIASATSDKKGEFKIEGIEEGIYRLTFRKTGLRLGGLRDVKVRANKTTELVDRLILLPDEGAFAFIRGSVFDPNGRSVQGAKIELARIFSDGSTKKIKEGSSAVDGQFSFRLLPDKAKYRVTVKLQGAETVSKDVDVDGAEIYRIAVTLEPKKN